MAKNKKGWLNPVYTPGRTSSDEHYSEPPPADDGDGRWAKSEHPPPMNPPSEPSILDELEPARTSWKQKLGESTTSTAVFPPHPLDTPAPPPEAKQEPQPTNGNGEGLLDGKSEPAPRTFSNAAPGTPATTIGPTIIVRGKLSSNENLIVRGRIEAEIRSTKDLHLESTGIINADMRVNSVTISGIVVGDIHAKERVKLAPEARVVGDIYTPRLIVQDGATFRGRIEMDGLEHLEGIKPMPAREQAQAAAAEAAAKAASQEIVISVEDENNHYLSDDRSGER